MLNLPDEVNEIILEFLPLKDLLNASLVCKKWMLFIGDSPSFRKRHVIRSSFNALPAISQKRKYESLNITQVSMNDAIKQLIKAHEWRTIYFNILKIPSQKDFVSIIKKMKYVRELKVMNVAIRKLTSHEKLHLEELEHLVFSDVAMETLETFMHNQPSLKSLSLRYLACDIASPRTLEEYVIEFLLLNQQILDLELYPDVVGNLFKVEISRVLSLKLRSLSLNLCDTNNAIRKNIEDFLKSQESSLEELKILFQQKFEGRRVYHRRGHWYEEDFGAEDESEITECKDITMLLNVWNNLSCLKKLTLRFFINFTESEVYPSMFRNFKANPNIQVLIIQHIGCTIPTKYVEMIMKLCPNLKSLYVTNLDRNVIKFCALNLMILRSISYSIEKDDAINFYGTLINSGDNEINKFIDFRKDYKG